MKLHPCLVLGALALSPAACVVEEGLDEDQLAIDEAALCLVPSSPGTPSQSRTVGPQGIETIDVTGYGTSQCARATIEFRSTLLADVTATGLTTQAACEGTRTFATYFLMEVDGSFTRDEVLSATGTWNGSSCSYPYIGYSVPPTQVQVSPGVFDWRWLPRTVRIVVSGQRTTCTTLPSGLEICGTTYGVPLRAFGLRRP